MNEDGIAWIARAGLSRLGHCVTLARVSRRSNSSLASPTAMSLSLWGSTPLRRQRHI
jgi:hypothetical protein